MISGKAIITRGGIGGISGNKVIVPFSEDADPSKIDVDAIKDHLKRELKIDMHTKQQKSLVKAMTTPGDWLDDRQTALNTIVDNHLAPLYKTSLAGYITAGYPHSQALDLAVADVQLLYDNQLKLLELEMPGAATLMTNAISENKMAIKKAALANGQLVEKKK